jgi:Tfp pilus assembly protein PilZ
MQQERRNRHRTRLPGAHVVYESARHEPHEAELHDLGTGGLFVPAATPLPRGTRLAMELRLTPGGPSWAALGRVVWTRASAAPGRPSGMGVKLVDVDEAAVAAIERAIGPAPPGREETVRGIGAPTPHAAWVAKVATAVPKEVATTVAKQVAASNGNAGSARGRWRATAAALLVAAAAATLGVIEGRIPALKGRAAAAAMMAEARVAAAPAPAPPPAPPEPAPPSLPTPPIQPTQAESTPPDPGAASSPAASVRDIPAVVAPGQAAASRPTWRPAPGRAWAPRPKRPVPAASDNPY